MLRNLPIASEYLIPGLNTKYACWGPLSGLGSICVPLNVTERHSTMLSQLHARFVLNAMKMSFQNHIFS